MRDHFVHQPRLPPRINSAISLGWLVNDTRLAATSIVYAFSVPSPWQEWPHVDDTPLSGFLLGVSKADARGDRFQWCIAVLQNCVGSLLGGLLPRQQPTLQSHRETCYENDSCLARSTGARPVADTRHHGKRPSSATECRRRSRGLEGRARLRGYSAHLPSFDRLGDGSSTHLRSH